MTYAGDWIAGTGGRRFITRAGALASASLLALACQAPQTEGDAKAEEAATGDIQAEALPTGAVIDLGDEGAEIEGFSPPEAVGTRFASWSEGEFSKVAFKLRSDSEQYLIAWLGEPYHAVGKMSVSVAMNQQPVAETSLERAWRAYKVVAPRDLLVEGRNELTFRYSSVARPSDVDPRSNDMRPLGVRFEQVQVQPIKNSVQLVFDNKSALTLSHLEEGWAFDPNDRGRGVWTLGNRSRVSFHLLKPEAGSYVLSVTASALPGVGERSVAVSLNGAALEPFTFGEARSSVRVEVPSERLRASNELVFEFDKVASPAQIDRRSKDQRPLGLRVLAVSVAPKVGDLTSTAQ
jgi:hypothetical protein